MTESKKNDSEKLAGLRHVPRAAMARAIAGVTRDMAVHPEHYVVGEAYLALLWDGTLAPTYARVLARIAAPALQFGAAKYGPGNYALTGFPVSRLLDAAARHLLCLGGPAFAPVISPLDPESGLHHAVHAAAMVLFAFECSLHADLNDCPVLQNRKLCR